MIGVLRDLTMNLDKTQNITLTVKGDCRGLFERLSGKQLDIELKQHRERRSLDANAYFHVLVGKIAAALNDSNENVKRELVIDYGTIDHDSTGRPVICMLPSTADVDAVCRYTRLFSQQMIDGLLINCYLVYKQTHLMDTAEMARLIDGAIYEAKELGIETATPEELQRLKEAWTSGR